MATNSRENVFFFVPYQTDAGDAGVVGDVGDVEDLALVVTAGLCTCGGQGGR